MEWKYGDWNRNFELEKNGTRFKHNDDKLMLRVYENEIFPILTFSHFHF